MATIAAPALSGHASPAPRSRVSSYNPNAIRRRVRLLEITTSGIALFSCYSLTRAGRTVKHSIEIDVQTQECRCNCESFRYMCSRHLVTMRNAAERGCKHIQRAAEILKRRDLVQVELGPAAALNIAPVLSASAACAASPREAIREVICPKCPAPLGTLGGETYCFACGEFINH